MGSAHRTLLARQAVTASIASLVIVLGTFCEKTCAAELERIGSWPFARPYAVAADPSRPLYFLGSGAGVLILSVADLKSVYPGEAEPISDIRTSGVVGDLFYDAPNELLYVAVNDGPMSCGEPVGEVGVEIWDVSNSSVPLHVSTIELPGIFRTPRGVAVQAGYAYVTSGWGLFVFDVSDPNSPQEVRLETDAPSGDLVVHGPYAYVRDRNDIDELTVVDISDPHWATVVGVIALPDPVSHNEIGTDWFAVSGQYLVTVGSEEGLVVIDIADPISPSVVGRCEELDSARSVALVDGYAIVCESAYLYAVDLSVPENPHIVNRHWTNSWPGYYGSRLAVAQGYAFAVGSDAYPYPQLSVHDVTQPAASLEEVGRYYTAGDVRGIAVAGGFAYLATDGYRGLQIIDVSDPAKPVELGHAGQWGLDVASCGDLVYLADAWGFTVYDVSNPLAPEEVGSWSGTSHGVTDLFVAGSVAYVVTSDLMQLVDVSNAASPALLSSIEGSGLQRVFATEGMACLTSDSEVRVFDVAVPDAPVEVGRYTVDDAKGVFVSGSHVFVATGADLLVLDVSDPSAPTLEGSLDWECHDVFIEDGYAYTARLSAVDVHDPSSPIKLAHFHSFAGEPTCRVVANAEYIYVTHPCQGLQIFELHKGIFAHAGQDQCVYDDGDGLEEVALDGRASYADTGIASYVWTLEEEVVGVGANPVVSLPVGRHDILLTVTDNDGCTDTDYTEVCVFPAVHLTGRLRVSRQHITPSFCSSVVGGPCFEDIAGLPYFVGDILLATFSITNGGTAPVTLEQVMVGGRFDDGELPGGGVPDFTAIGPITLETGETHDYEGTLELPQQGEYHFFCTYELEASRWNPAIPLADGLTDDDRTFDLSVRYRVPTHTGSKPALETVNLSEDERSELYKIVSTILAADEAEAELFGGDQAHLLYEVKKLMHQVSPDPEIHEAGLEVHDVMADYLLEDEAALAMDVVEEGVGMVFKHAGTAIANGWLYLGGLYFKMTADFLERLGLNAIEQYYLRDVKSATVTWPGLGRLDITWFVPNKTIVVNVYLASYGKKGGFVVATERWRDVYECISTEHACSTVPVYGSLLQELHEGLEANVLDRVEFIQLHSPAEILVINAQGDSTGVRDGAVQDSIAGVVCIPETGLIAAKTEPGEIAYEVAGTADGTYSLRARVIEDGDYTPFEAVDMPIGGTSVHSYEIDWNILSEGGSGANVVMDEDGDGSPEVIVEAGRSLEAKNTQIGSRVGISLLEGRVRLEFESVVEGGNTYVSTSEPDSDQPQGVTLLPPEYSFTSTASWTGSTTMTLAYDDSALSEYEEDALGLFRSQGDTWVNITTARNTEENEITGITDGFSVFAVGVILSDIETPAVFRIDSAGRVFADQTVHAASFSTEHADVAEWVTVTGDVEVGDVLAFDSIQPLCYRLASYPCSSLVAGVVSSEPGLSLGQNSVPDSSRALLALVGIVPVKVTNEGGPIQPGDLLVTSSTPGHAMRWPCPDPCPCSLVGKALEPMTDERGVILVLLTAH